MEESEFQIPETLAGRSHRVGLVLGSGLGGVVECMDDTETAAYADIGGMPLSGVEGHAGRLVSGRIAGVAVAAAQGRVHLYEGWSAREAAAPVRLLHALGATTVLLTNAAGIVNENFQPGRWMLIADHLNLAGASPLSGSARFLDQSRVYSEELGELLKTGCLEQGLPALVEGVYAWMPGPEYETPAEIRMLRILGADAVGMSTVPEAIQARALGMRVAGLSCLTNYGAGIGSGSLNHEEVMETGRGAARDLAALLRRTLPSMEGM